MHPLILVVVTLLHWTVGANGARALRVTAAGTDTSIVDMDMNTLSPAPSPPPKSESVGAVDETSRPFCVSDENSLRAQLLQGGTVYMCHGSNIAMNKTFYVSDTSFELRCRGQRTAGPVDFGSSDVATTPCILSGSNKIRLFRGYRNQAKFYDITFKDGYGGSFGKGGALEIHVSVVEVVRCVFIGNQARYGGAIYMRGLSSRLAVQDSLFLHNKAMGTSLVNAGHGGALYLSDGVTASVSGTTIKSNFATGSGSAIKVTNDADVTLINSVIHSNNGKAGAPLDCEKGDVVLRDSVFKNNTWADSILSHICVRDNDDPLTNGGSYVLCDLYERVYFCDNWISIYEVDQYTTEPPISNTNCEDYGIVNKTHPRCLAL